MLRPSSRRSHWLAIPLLALAGALLLPATAASAAKETFHRFEVEGTANYTITEDCADGSTAETLVTVIGGHEEESVNEESTLDSDFLTVLIRGFDCASNLINDRGSGPAEFTFSSGLSEASVSGTIMTRDGRTVAVDMAWEGVGGIEVTNNITTFPGFHGHFQGKERDAVATGTVVVDGETVVDGTTTNARIESLEDTNTRTSE
jgi:hypothetical protein